MAKWSRSFVLVGIVASYCSQAGAQGGGIVEPLGEASYRIPIVVPPGPAGHQPELALVYASGEGRGAASWLGFGWSLAGESRIERATRTGSPYDYDNPTCGASGLHPCYRADYALDGQDLVCASGTCAACTASAPCRYRTQSDDGRLIEFLGELSGWRIRDRDGRTLLYGAASDGSTRLANPASLTGQVFAWQLERSTDVSGNEIRFVYDRTSSPGVAYLARIEYGQGTNANRSVELVLNDPIAAPRPDRPVSARAGFRQQTDRRVTAIDVRASGALVTRYELAYSQDPDSTRSQLASVRRVGSDGSSALPPHRFDYSFRAASQGLTGTFESSFTNPPSCHPGGGNYASNPVSGTVETIADVNRDGLADLYQVDGANGPAPGGVRVALGNGQQLLAPSGPACASSSEAPRGALWSESKLLFSHARGGSAAMDVDGDGYLDHLFLREYPWGEADPGLRLGSDAGFLEPPLPSSLAALEYPPVTGPYTILEPFIRIAETDAWGNVELIAGLHDLTADGRPDLVVTTLRGPLDLPGWESWTGWGVFVNRGIATGAGGAFLDLGGEEPTRWLAPADAPIQHNDYGGVATRVLLADQNGDGLADRVSPDGVEYGYGAGFLARESLPNATGSLGLSAACTIAGVADLNGDGLLDHVNTSGASSSHPYWRVHFGTGHGFSPQWKSFPADGGGLNPACLEADGQTAQSTALRDMNGDGVPDRLRDGIVAGVMLNTGALDPNAAADPDLPSAVLPGLLLRATDPLGGAVEFTYQAATQARNDNGLPANPGFSRTRPVVVRAVARDGRAGTPAITTLYAYAAGAFDHAEKEFRGFGQVVATQLANGAPAARTTTAYRTDRDCAFNAIAIEAADGASVLARTRMSYQVVTGGGAAGWSKCLLVERSDEAVEGDESAKRVRRTAFHYGDPIDPHYNLARLEEWGEWNPSANQDVPGDERITEYAYASASSAFPSIVSRLRLETVKDAAGNTYARRQVCYFTAGCVAAGSGRPVVFRAYLTDYSANPPPLLDVPKTLATIGYDAYGNPVQHTGPATAADPDGLRTDIAYEPTYRTFPVSVSVGADVPLPLRPSITAFAHEGCAAGLAPPPGLGLPCRVTIPGGLAESLGYDAVGRLVRRERLESGYTETHAYALPGATDPGNNVFETRVLRAGQADLIERSFVDGLGRAFRHESPGAATETVVVERGFDERGLVATESLPYSSGEPLARAFSYDALGRPRRALDADGETLRVLSYAPWTTIEEAYLGGESPSYRAQRSERSVDGRGRLVHVTQFEDAIAASRPLVVSARYDAADRPYEVRDAIANDPSLCSALATPGPCATQDHVTEIQWDSLGRRVRVADPDSGVWTFRYDDAGRELERTHNGGTNQARTRLTSYDALGRPSARSFAPSGLGTANATLVYENDAASPAFGQLVEVQSAGTWATSYRYGYDAAGRRDSVVQRTAGLEFGAAWQFDELGRVTRKLFPDGEAFDYAWDGARLREIRADPANTAFTGAVLMGADYDALGRATLLAIGERANGSPIATQAYGYDPVSARLARITGSAGGPSADDPDGDRVGAASDSCPNAWNPEQTDVGGLGEASAPDGVGDACQCGDVDANGRVTVSDALAVLMVGMGWPLAAPALCDVDGDESCDPTDFFVLMAALSSGGGDLQHCPASLPDHTPSSAPLDLELDFDGLGRLLSQTGTLGGEPVDRSYDYDGLSRLVRAVGPWEKPRGEAGDVTWSWTYDALGNLRSQTSSRPPGQGDHRAWRYLDPTRPRFLSLFARDSEPWEAMTATAGGEPSLITRGNGQWTETLVWNALGKLHRRSGVTYHYDAFGDARLLVLGPSGGSTSIVRVGEDFEYDRVARRANKSFSLGGMRFATLATSYQAPNAGAPPAPIAATLSSGPGAHGRHAEPILAYLSDHLGSTRAVVNRDGAVVETRDYDPLGGSIAHVGDFAVQHRFTGQPQDAGERLYNYGARFYDPKWGRFVSPDQLTQGFDSQGLNPYAYVLNAPTNHVDPTGEIIFNGWSFGAWSMSTLENQGITGRGPGGRQISLAEATRPGVAGLNADLRAGVLVGDDAAKAAEIADAIAKQPESGGEPKFEAAPKFTESPGSYVVECVGGELGEVSGGIAGPLYGVGSGLVEIGKGIATLDLAGAGWGAFELVKALVQPRSGSHSGWGYPGDSGAILPETGTKLDNASIWHDWYVRKHGYGSEAQFGWIVRAWTGPGVELGPWGQAYRLLGTVGFGVAGAMQAAAGY